MWVVSTVVGVTAPLLDLLRQQPSVDVQTEVCWLFAFLTAKEDATVAALMEQGLAQVMVGVASSASAAAMSTVPCVRVLVNISSGPLQWLEALFALPALLPALALLSDVNAAQKAVAKVRTLDRAYGAANHCVFCSDGRIARLLEIDCTYHRYR